MLQCPAECRIEYVDRSKARRVRGYGFLYDPITYCFLSIGAFLTMLKALSYSGRRDSIQDEVQCGDM
jgi:hypothetical protein